MSTKNIFTQTGDNSQQIQNQYNNCVFENNIGSNNKSKNESIDFLLEYIINYSKVDEELIFEDIKICNIDELKAFIFDFISTKNIGKLSNVTITTNYEKIHTLSFNNSEGTMKLEYSNHLKQENILCKKICLLFELIKDEYIYSTIRQVGKFYTDIILLLIQTHSINNSSTGKNLIEVYSKDESPSISFLMDKLLVDQISSKYNFNFKIPFFNSLAIIQYDVIKIFYTAAINDYVNNNLQVAKKSYFSLSNKYISYA